MANRGQTAAGSHYGHSGKAVEEVLLDRGVPRHELLLSLSAYYGAAFVEYDEEVAISQAVTRGMDLERFKGALWIPVPVGHGQAEVITSSPDSPETLSDIKKTLGVENVRFTVALPSDLVRIIENHQDLNPDFSPSSGRTPLAKTRTFLANRRTQLAYYRTELAKGRTGLAFTRTGMAFIRTGMSVTSVGMGLLVYFGAGSVAWTAFEVSLTVAGIESMADGLYWHIPAEKTRRQFPYCFADLEVTVPDYGRPVREWHVCN